MVESKELGRCGERLAAGYLSSHGDVTEEKLRVLREADDIFIKGLRNYDCPTHGDSKPSCSSLPRSVVHAAVHLSRCVS